jgi:CheY-like chemotaxis protein/Tfp pilus assembly protein PilF
MTPLDPDIQDCKALVIDGNPTSRSTLVAMLRDWGVGTVIQTGRTADARKALENRAFDIVLCEQHFEHAHGAGQELLDELRRAGLLPFSTVFVMVTGEASYAKVAEAAESALDSYLLKPHNAETLGERLRQARRRKRVLKDIYDAIEGEDFQHAARLCMQRFAERAEYWLYAARIGAELLLRVGDHESARKLYEAVRETQALPWAKLGVARAFVEAGDTPQAKRTLDSLISDNPGYADAYDVMGRVQIEHGDLAGAMETYRRACDLTPSCIGRLQKAGMVAFYSAEADEAEKCLERATLLGISSKMYDKQTLVLLSLLKFDRGDAKALTRAKDNLAHMLEKWPDDTRLQRFMQVIDVLGLLLDKQLARVVAQTKSLVAQWSEEDFDFEAAGNLLALLVRVLRTEVALPDGEMWVQQIARRFCVSKAAADMLAGISRRVPAYEKAVRDAHAEVNKMAEEAMNHTVRGTPETAVRMLIDKGQDTLNAKLIELANKVLQRHHARISGGVELADRCSALLMRFCVQGTRINLNEVGRSAGAIALR